MLEAGQVAPDDDQVHPLLVRHVEVAHDRAVVVGDREAQRRAAPARQVGARHDQAQAVVGDREPADAVRAVGARGVAVLVAGRVVVAAHRVATLVRARRGVDGGTRQRGGGERQREHREEAGEPDGGAHAVAPIVIAG